MEGEGVLRAEGRRGLSANAIKIIISVLMLVDHCTYIFIPYTSPWAVGIRTLTRVVAPTFCFFLVEGFFHTHSKEAYARRLGIFALISHLPYTILFYGTPIPNPFQTSIFFTLLCGLLSICAWETLPSYPLKVLAMALFILMSTFGDWSYYVVIMVWIFYFFRGKFGRQTIAISVLAVVNLLENLTPYITGIVPIEEMPAMSFFVLGIPLAMILIRCYNGQRGRGGRVMKWFFYAFYPLHLLAILLVIIIIKSFM